MPTMRANNLISCERHMVRAARFGTSRAYPPHDVQLSLLASSGKAVHQYIRHDGQEMPPSCRMSHSTIRSALFPLCLSTAPPEAHQWLPNASVHQPLKNALRWSKQINDYHEGLAFSSAPGAITHQLSREDRCSRE